MMVTHQQVREHVGRRPFQPFRVTLKNGEAIDIVRTLQAVAMPRQFVVGTPHDRLRWIHWAEIERVDAFEMR